MKKAGLILALLAMVLLPGCPSSDKTESTQEDLVEVETPEDVLDVEQPDVGADAEDVLDDASVGPCKDGDVRCINGKLATCDTALGWLLENCPEGTSCLDDACISTVVCEPLATQCVDDSVQVCSPTGEGWSEPMPCAEGQICKGGLCVEEDCQVGDKQCVGNKAIVCTEDGTVVILECDEDEVCFDGECIECTKDADCDEGMACIDGVCTAPELALAPEALPDGKVGQPYEAQFVASGGIAPYVFAFGIAGLPDGLSADAGLAKLQGTPTEAGTFEILVEVTDGAGTKLERVFNFQVFPADVAIVITTGSPLPQGEEGTAYSATLQATGGTEPYSWGVVGGALPDGLQLASNGTIAGTPAAHGTFTFMVKVFDNADTVHMASKEFELTLKIAPLEIVGSQQYDLFVAKIIVLPLLTAVEGIPLPYSTNLEAKGGVKPYTWTEQPLPSYVSYLIPNGGIPNGLKLETSGQLHGSVTDTGQAISVNVPFVNINVTGFFFMGKVSDSQDPADTASAIYLIPTVPVSF